MTSLFKSFVFTSAFYLLAASSFAYAPWGFFAHQEINKLAAFTLPAEVMPFYKKHLLYLSENAVNPDRRRYAVEGEAPKHYIDLDVYGKNALDRIPHRWDSAVATFSEDTLRAYGIVPWNTYWVYRSLVKAFDSKKLDLILRYSADLGHYIGDANVPLHTTENYNGQLTNQHGIHGLWESRLPQLFSTNYDFFVGRATYIPDVQEYIWSAIEQAHLAKDSVLTLEKALSNHTKEDKKYSYETKGNINTRTYSERYSTKYHEMLNCMVERQMRKSIKMIGDIWYTAWVDAGQPDINDLLSLTLKSEETDSLKTEKKRWHIVLVKCRAHEH